MSNTSATGGYLVPSPLFPTLPGGLTLREFVQTVFVGISGLPGDLVRPSWQIDPPKQPDITVNWLALALVENVGNANAYSWTDSAGNNQTQRMEELEIKCSFYGPASAEYAALVRDGFYISQNLEALRAASMGFVSATRATHAPDLVNERWCDRYEMSVFLRREILRVYPILTFLSAAGTIKAVVGGVTKTIAWNSQNGEG